MYLLDLKNGIRWVLVTRSPMGSAVLRLLADAMLLDADCDRNSRTVRSVPENTKTVVLDLIDACEDVPLKAIPSIDLDMIQWPLLAHRHSRFTFINAFRIAQFIGISSEQDGGVLIHGALAEKNGKGIVLAGPSGSGKSTASTRLPAPWNSLSDDTVLIVRRTNGGYWAHPWPTWSRINAGDRSEHADTKRSVPLAGMFFLQKAREDVADTLATKNAVGMLLGCAEVATGSLLVDLAREQLIPLRQKRFLNLLEMASSIPHFNLKISRKGRFWERIELALSNN